MTNFDCANSWATLRPYCTSSNKDFSKLIKSAYRNAGFVWHPDKCKGTDEDCDGPYKILDGAYTKLDKCSEDDAMKPASISPATDNAEAIDLLRLFTANGIDSSSARKVPPPDDAEIKEMINDEVLPRANDILGMIFDAISKTDLYQTGNFPDIEIYKTKKAFEADFPGWKHDTVHDVNSFVSGAAALREIWAHINDD